MGKVYGIIYKTTCLVNGKIYIGQLTRLNRKSYLGSGTYLKSAIKKYGKENFKRETLIECYNQTELDEWEYLLIWEYNSMDKNIGYNIAMGAVLGSIGTINHMKLPEVRKKISEANKGNKRRLGKYNSDKIKNKISEHTKIAMNRPEIKNKMNSPEIKEKHRISIKESLNRPECKAKMSKSAKEVWNRPGYKEKMSICLKGLKKSDETKKKISESKMGIKNGFFGKKHSEESRAKMKEAAKSIPVLQYDKQGNFIAEYYGAVEAGRQLGIFATGITACCKGKQKSAGGYIWKYK